MSSAAVRKSHGIVSGALKPVLCIMGGAGFLLSTAEADALVTMFIVLLGTAFCVEMMIAFSRCWNRGKTSLLRGSLSIVRIVSQYGH